MSVTTNGVVWFDQAFNELIGHEGGYVNNPDDPGGETKYGVSKRSYPDIDIKTLTLQRAKDIYYRDFWAATAADKMKTYDLAYAVFDAAVNSGVSASKKWLQMALKVEADGKLGVKSLAALSNLTAEQERVAAARMLGYRLDAMTYMRWSTFGKGWARRIAALLQYLD